MRVSDVLRSKGSRVETIGGDATVPIAVHRLRAQAIGALVVSGDGVRVDGIVSERDIVSGLAQHGSEILRLAVADVMDRDVPTCSPGDALQDVMSKMTRRRARHLPVVQDGRLCGIVSIGDVVKARLDEVELERQIVREAYIAHR